MTWQQELAKGSVPEIRERVQHPKGNELYYKLMAKVFEGTDILDVAMYPKRTGRDNF